MTQVRVIEDAAGWAETLASCGAHDFAHTWDFHQISHLRGEGRPVMYVVSDDAGRSLAAWPLLRRSLAEDRHDLTSVYGHVGPLVADTARAAEALAAMVHTMGEQGAVSLFSRMHPILDHRLPDSWRGDSIGQVVIIDAATTDDLARPYRTDHRQGIAKARARGVTIYEESGPSAVTMFHDIYSETMTDLAAADFYFFEREYFERLMLSQAFQTILLFAEFEGETVSAAMFIRTGDIMQYYLSGTRRAHRALAAAKVLIAEAHRRATEAGVRWLVLGGGLGSREDGLFAFKRGFSDLTAPFHVTRRILDQRAYADLSISAGVDPATTGYFPAYRQVGRAL